MSDNEVKDVVDSLRAHIHKGFDLVEKMIRQDAQLLALTEQILENRTQVLHAIPECPIHGNECVPHALKWIEERREVDDEPT